MVAPQLSHGGRPAFDGTAHAWLAVGPDTDEAAMGTDPPYGQEPTA